MNAAANRPAERECTSLVKPYVANAVNPANNGAMNTQTLRICNVMLNACNR
jgi:hypothetical protein